MPNETPTWEDTIDAPSWDDTSPIDSQFRRDELAKQTFESRIEGERAKLGTALATAGGNAAYWVADALAKVDPTGVSANILARHDVQRTPPILAPEDIETAVEVVKKGLHIPETAPAEGKLGEVTRGLTEASKEMAVGFSDPGMIAGLGLAKKLPQEGARLFQYQMMGALPTTVEQAMQAQNLEEAVKGGAGVLGNVAFPIMLAKPAAGPSIPIPDFVGRQLEMQRGAIPPRAEPVAPIERVTPEQAAVAAERMSAPFDLAQPYIGFSTPKVEPPSMPREPRSIREAWQSFEKSATATPNELVLVAEKLMEEGNAPGSLRLPINIYKQAMEAGQDPNLAEFRVLAMIEKIAKETPPEIPSGELKVKPLEKPDVTPTVTETAKPEVAAMEVPKVGTITPKEWDSVMGTAEEYPLPPNYNFTFDSVSVSNKGSKSGARSDRQGGTVSASGNWTVDVRSQGQTIYSKSFGSTKSGGKQKAQAFADQLQDRIKSEPTPKPAETPVEGAKEISSIVKADVKADPRLDEPGITRKAQPNSLIVQLRDLDSNPVREVIIESTGDALADSKAFAQVLAKEADSRKISRRESGAISTGPNGLAINHFSDSPNGVVWTSAENLIRAREQINQPAQPIPQGPGARTAQTIEAPESYSGTALKNATAEIERAGWGMAEAPEHVRQSIPEAWIRAGRTLERDPMAGQKLVDELQADPKGRGLSVDESALLLRQKVILSNEMNAAAERIHTGKTPLDKARAEAEYAWAHEKMLTMLDAIKNRGTAWGQEGRWRQVMAREDFSLATLITQREAALGKKILPGSPEFAELEKHANRLKEINDALEKRVADVEKAFQDSEVKRAMAEAQAQAQTPYHPRILELAEGYAKKWDARGAKALEELKAMFSEGQAFSGAPISPAMLDRAIIYGTSKMVRGAVDLAKWTDVMVKDLGEGFRKYAKDVFDASKRAFDQDVKTDFKKPEVERRVKGALKGADLGTETTLRQISQKASKTPEGRLPNIGYYLRKLGRVYAREGIKEEGPFLDRMTADVQKVLPTLTRDDVRAIFGGYAEEVRALSKEPVEVILRDMRGQAQELHKLSLLKQKIIPPKLQERATPSEKQRQLRKQVEAEKRTGGFAPPDPEVQLRSAMQSAETRLTNQITDLQREIDTKQKIAPQKREPLHSEKLDALRAHRDALREIHNEVFKKPDLTDAERLEIWKERVKEQIDELRDRRQRGDFKPKPKPDPIRFDKQAIELQFLKEVEHRALMEMRARDELSKRTTPEVIKDSAKNAAMFAHMAMAGGEFSAVFKQGATGAYSMPVRTARNFAKSLQAWWSEENQFKIKHEILTRDNAPFYRRDKLEFTDVGGRLSSMEEMYMFRVMDWMKKVPGLSHYVRYMDRFQRAFSTFLNLMRADTYDAMVREMGSSPEAGQSAANYINVATGRGSHSTARFGGSGANAIFFAPRWSISRFQYLLGQPILAAKPGYKKYIVKQYAKTLMGLGSIYALGYAMGGDVDWNPTSSKFGKIKIGNRVIDPLFGLAPVMRIIAQQVTGLRKNYKGKVRPIREGGKLPIFEQQIEGSRKLGPYDPSGAELMGKFAWSKLAPAPEATVSAAAGENVIGEKFSVGQKLGQLVTPITYRDVINAIREEGIDEKTAIDLMAIFGLSSYVEKPRKSSTNF